MTEINMNPQKKPGSGSPLWLSGTPGMLVFTPPATRQLQALIGWQREDFPDNRNEQGGLLIGRKILDAFGTPFQAEVTDVLLAKTDCRFPGYIEWSAQEEIRMQQIFFDMQDRLALTDPAAAEALAILGWWHTHPNDLPVFMSGTDMETQRLKYFRPDKYAVVLNPHKGIFRAFAGKDAIEVPAVMLMEDPNALREFEFFTECPTRKVPDRTCRKQNYHYKRCHKKFKHKRKNRK